MDTTIPSQIILISTCTWINTHPTILTASLTILLASYIFLRTLLHLTQHPAEPPAVLTSIPFLSPILSMTRHSMDFYTHMYQHNKTSRDLPIYTLRLPGKRIYIVNSTSFIPIIQRQWKRLLFAPVTIQAMEGAFGVDKRVVDLAKKKEDMISENGFVNGLNKVVHPVLAGGSLGLRELNSRAAGVLSSSLDGIDKFGSETRAGEGRKVQLYEWIRHELMIATTDAVFGIGEGRNPLRDPKNEDAWCTFSPVIMFLVLNLFPLAFFKKPIRARETLAASFREYFRRNKEHWKQDEEYSERAKDDQDQDRGPSEYIKAWTRQIINICGRNDIPVETTIGNLYVGSLFALVANTMPACYWMVYRVFSDAEIAKACREEVSRAVKTEGDNVRVLDADYLKRKCPLLLSTFQEVFRVHGMANSVRIAEEDYVLDAGEDVDGNRKSYLIKKGGMVMMPARVQHYMRDVWGDDVDVFDHRRFLKENLKMKKSGSGGMGKKYNPVAFRGFGGGTTLCPGRHFATTEILVFTALLLLRFEIVPTKDGGNWTLPTTVNSSQAEAIEQPDVDFEVELRPRGEAVGVEWRVSFDEDVQAKLVAEDL